MLLVEVQELGEAVSREHTGSTGEMNEKASGWDKERGNETDNG